MTHLGLDLRDREPVERLRYRVTWSDRPLLGVRRVSGLTRLTEAIVHREGGDPSPSRKLPGRTEYLPVTLELGAARNVLFEDWAEKAVGLSSKKLPAGFRKDILVELLDESGQPVLACRLFRCWVSEYSILPEPEGGAGPVVIQRFRVQNEGWKREA